MDAVIPYLMCGNIRFQLFFLYTQSLSKRDLKYGFTGKHSLLHIPVIKYNTKLLT